MTHWRSQPAAMMGSSEVSRPRRISPDMVTDAGDLSGVGAFRSSQSSHRPQVYVHVEFGVSWTSRHIPNNHVLSYKSRGLRDRLANFPREVPAPTTNYLSSSVPPLLQTGQPTSFDDFAVVRRHDQQRRGERHSVWESLENQRRREHQSQSRRREEPTQSTQLSHHQQRQQQQHRNHRQKQPQQQPKPQQHAQPQPQQQHRVQESPLSQMYLSTRYQSHRDLTPVDEEQRSSRSSRDSRSSHERGHSEPPPLSGSPWDITTGDASGLQHNYSGSRYVVPSSSVAGPSRGPVQIWKDLPDLPTRYRLGEGLPWSQGLPEPAADPDDERLRPRSQPEAGDSSSIHQSLDYSPFRPFSNRPTVIPIQVEDTESQRQRDIDTQKKRDLEALSMAMMTIDNGFESQWWNQGKRENTDARSPTAPTPSVWPSGMSSSALPVSLVLPPSLQGDSDDEEQQSKTAGPSTAVPMQTSSLPSSPTSPRRIRMASLGWAIATSPVSTEPTNSAMPPSPVSSVLPRHPQRISSLGNQRVSQQVVSPVSEFAGTDLWSPEARNRQLSRSMTSRSEELFFTTGRYA
ncbi:hypothetical protein SEUCBS139899_004598 [Sporothrix eucalyptigena]|uniref:Uncharacterized protein n=1 Tax=Sporothrix eucalyptigena TaxID=1812306 RepID=A0ABP0BPN7_9PEZI